MDGFLLWQIDSESGFGKTLAEPGKTEEPEVKDQ